MTNDHVTKVTQTCSICGKTFEVEKQYATSDEEISRGRCFCCLSCMDERNRRNGHVCGRDPCGDPFADE